MLWHRLPVLASYVIALIAVPLLASEPSVNEIATWIAQLSSPRYAEREAASRRLAALPDVPPALLKAMESPDAEVARRARTAVEQIRQTQLEQRIQKDLARINAEGVDLFIERMAHQPGFATDERWQAVERLADALVSRSISFGRVNYRKPVPEWTKLSVRDELPRTVVFNSRVLLKGMNEPYTGISKCLVVNSGSMRRLTGIDNSVVLVAGDIEGCTGLHNSLVLCTGSVGYVTSVSDSIVLARGEFAGSTSAQRSLFQVKSVGRHTSANSCVYINLTAVPGAQPAVNDFPKSDRGPLDAIKFFDPAQLGIRTKQVDAETYVESLTVNSPFDKSGLRKGDELLSVGGRKWNTQDEFRAILIRALMQEGASIRVRRGERVVELRVKFEPQENK